MYEFSDGFKAQPLNDVPTHLWQRHPPSRLGFAFIDWMATLGITAGCGGDNYCPDALVTREQIAIFIERALGVFTPATTIQTFQDVGAPMYSWPFVEDFVACGITSDC